MGEPMQTTEPVPAVITGLKQVLERARRGDVTALPELREALRSRPDLVHHCGDLAVIAERAWIAVASGQDLLVAESLGLRLAELRAELAGPNPTPLERLAVERIAITWLQAWFADVAAAGAGDVPPKVAAFALERQDRAAKRHLAALANLTMIRRLAPDLGAVARDSEPHQSNGPGVNHLITTGLEPSRPDAAAHLLSIVSVDDQDVSAVDE